MSSHTIQEGDTFSAVAARFGSTVEAIEAANPGVDPNQLQIGQTINLPSSEQNTGGGTEAGAGYASYGGPASNYPDPSRWAAYSVLWDQNCNLMKFNDTPEQVALIGQSVETVASESGLDARAILCMIMQESGGNVHVGSTNNGVNNTGIMQAYNGVSFSPDDEAGTILQMIRDGAAGSSNGPGLKQAFEKYGNYYIAFRVYNSGNANLDDLNDPRGATPKYVEDIANRLMGHVWDGM